jgi:tRNA-(ms[2]io[6]A)-hydroxylase
MRIKANEELLNPIFDFLLCETPDEWAHAAIENQSVLLIDHANCEKKAAATAMNLMYRYVEKPDLLTKMSQLAREELLHFQQVVEIMIDRGVDYTHLSASRYASSLRDYVTSTSMRTSDKLSDTLLVGAIIEARSCERFAKLIPFVDEDLGKFYQGLLKSEARHYQDYLNLAELYCGAEVKARVAELLSFERSLIISADKDFRFHSGIPT